MRKLLLLLMVFSISFLLLNAEEKSKNNDFQLPEVKVESEKIESTFLPPSSSISTKVSEENLNIPQSVTVFGHDFIEDTPTFNFQDVITNDSSVSPADFIFLPKIRGFNAEVLKEGYSPTRGFPLNVFNAELSNIQRIEILKGPSSILFGNTSSGGIINLVKKKPLDYDLLFIDGSIGDENLYSVALDYNKVITDEVQFRNIISYYDSDSFRDFIEDKRFLLNPGLRLYLGDRTKVDFDIEYYYTENTFDGGIVAVGNNVADIPFTRNLGDKSENGKFRNLALNLSLETVLTQRLKLINRFHYNYNKWKVFNVLPLALAEDNRTLLRALS